MSDPITPIDASDPSSASAERLRQAAAKSSDMPSPRVGNTVQQCPRTLSWIEISLHWEDGKPVADEAYRIIGPNGVERTGYLDADGRARVDDLVPGACQVSFPKLDRDLWHPA